jgi:hypothetical protein
MDKMKIDAQYWKDFGHWHLKMHFLTKEIERLKKQNDLTSLISAFLLETQYIEFHLQGFITELDIVNDTEPKLMKFSGKKRKKEVYEMTLGELKDEIRKYNADFLKDLKTNLYELNKIRVQFAHHIFTYATGVDDLLKSAKAGISINTKVLISLNSAFKFIEKNSRFGKMMESKKVKYVYPKK